MMHWLCWWRPPCLLRRVVVNFAHDPTEAIEGALFSYRGGWLTLQDVSGMKSGHPLPVPVTGEVVIHRSQIKFLQVVP
jgi:hypothetical protein